MNPNFFNLSKKKKLDILSDLLVGKESEGIISKKELNALNRIIESQPASKAPVNAGNRPAKTTKVTAAPKNTQTAKKKTTLYLTQEISENLDTVQTAIRSYVSENLRSRVSKSHIVNQALAMILQDFETNGKNSRLMRTILQEI